ncbi:conserved hypothetical protein [Histoplasma capsulatum H143]|uniref:Uncharacterized protein n=1 Tax=Ajellomyces capsulatus (strain H143) TaxID=544712 RepID=C6HS48_AJECH|nr:conserved hypothetical protein [Histoplasma capsulatum H143]
MEAIQLRDHVLICHTNRHPKVTESISPSEKSLLLKRHAASMSDTKNEGILRIFYGYGKLVELYAVQQLTIPVDNLDAFSGTLRVLAGHLGDTFMSGFPVESPYLVLLWTSVYPLVLDRLVSGRGIPPALGVHTNISDLEFLHSLPRLEFEDEQEIISGPDFGPDVLQF